MRYGMVIDLKALLWLPRPARSCAKSANNIPNNIIWNLR